LQILHAALVGEIADLFDEIPGVGSGGEAVDSGHFHLQFLEAGLNVGEPARIELPRHPLFSLQGDLISELLHVGLSGSIGQRVEQDGEDDQGGGQGELRSGAPLDSGFQ
jgi:hypothetical protein